MKSKKDMITTKIVPLGEILKGKSFTSFDKLRKKANKIVGPLRDNWLQAVLIKNNIFVNFDLMTRREIVEIFEQQKIVMLDEDGIYRIYKEGEVIGEWQNSRKIKITPEGILTIEIKYVIV